jgi:hypothetical protein
MERGEGGWRRPGVGSQLRAFAPGVPRTVQSDGLVTGAQVLALKERLNASKRHHALEARGMGSTNSWYRRGRRVRVQGVWVGTVKPTPPL